MPELIDRQALIADYRICGGCSDFEDCKGYVTMCDSARIRQAINEAPTIEPEARHGKWIFRDDDKSLIEEGILPADMWCSNCGKHHDNDDYGDDYCSTCGVKMDLPDEYEEKTWGADNDA